MGLILGQGTKIPHAMGHAPPKKKKKLQQKVQDKLQEAGLGLGLGSSLRSPGAQRTPVSSGGSRVEAKEAAPLPENQYLAIFGLPHPTQLTGFQ